MASGHKRESVDLLLLRAQLLREADRIADELAEVDRAIVGVAEAPLLARLIAERDPYPARRQSRQLKAG